MCYSLKESMLAYIVVPQQCPVLLKQQKILYHFVRMQMDFHFDTLILSHQFVEANTMQELWMPRIRLE